MSFSFYFVSDQAEYSKLNSRFQTLDSLDILLRHIETYHLISVVESLFSTKQQQPAKP